MVTNTVLKKDLGKVASALDENISEEEMDRLLADRRDEIEALLEEAREAKRCGSIAPLEPLHAFLRRARERLRTR
jgi:phage tail tape-measure protein